MDEPTQARRRHQELADRADRPEPPPSEGAATFLVQTATKASYPTAAGRVYACKRAKVACAETEGAAVTVTTYGGFLYVANLGTAVPPPGTNLLATTADGGRHTARYDG